MKTGLIILNYNDWKRTAKLAESSAMIDEIDHVCIIDNCSTDDSFYNLQKKANDKIVVLQSQHNGGYAAGNNVGARCLIEKYGVDVLFIANPDVVFDADTVRTVIKAFEKENKYAALSPVMVDANGDIDPKPFIYFPSAIDNILLCFYTYNRFYERKHSYKVFDNTIQKVDALQGSFWAVRAEVLKKIGYLDEGTFLYFEELCFAAKLRDKMPELEMGLVTDASYFHFHSATIRSNLSELRMFRIYMNSKEYFARKYLKCKGVSLFLLKAAIAVSIFEERVFLFLTRKKNGVRKGE